MGYGHCWGNSATAGGRAVAKAFFAGKTLKRGNAETDGRKYYLFGHVIAIRVAPEDVAELVQTRLTTGKHVNLAPFRFSCAGRLTPTTIRHLDALGVSITRLANKPWYKGHPLDVSAFYTPEEAEATPVPVKRVRGESKAFVNLTPDMFA